MNNTISYQLTQQELYQTLQLTLRKASKGRLITQSILLVVVAAISLIDYLTAHSPKPTMRLVMVVVALVIMPTQWLLPNWRFRTLAKEMADKGDTLYLTFQQDAIRVGKDEQAVTIPLTHCGERLTVYPKQQLAVLNIDQRQWIPIPRRVLPPESWDMLLDLAM